MSLNKINSILAEVKSKLQALDPNSLQEAQKSASQHNPKKTSAAKRHLDWLYSKLTNGRTDATTVKATGAKR